MILACKLQGSRSSNPYGHIIFDSFMLRKLISSRECGVCLTDSTSPIQIFHQYQGILLMNRFSVGIEHEIGLEPNLEYSLGLLNVNGNRAHLNQTHDYLLRPQDYIPFKFKARGHLYDSPLSKWLIKYRLQQRCNNVSWIVNQSIYHVSRDTTWENLTNSRSLIFKGCYHPPLTNLHSLI